MNILSLSGGKDSSALLLMMVEKGIPIHRVIFIDTTKEFPAMYDHLDRLQMVCPVEIERVPIAFDYWFGEHIKTKGKHAGKKGYGWPDHKNRWCTALKRDTVKQIQVESGVDCVHFHGIAYDERERCENNQDRGMEIRYPLVEWGITEQEALNYCYERGYTWGGLYRKFGRVSCWCCPLSKIGELRTLYNEYPEAWDQLVDMDKKSFRKFRSDYTVDELEHKFENEKYVDTGFFML